MPLVLGVVGQAFFLEADLPEAEVLELNQDLVLGESAFGELFCAEVVGDPRVRVEDVVEALRVVRGQVEVEVEGDNLVLVVVDGVLVNEPPQNVEVEGSVFAPIIKFLHKCVPLHMWLIVREL